MDSKAKNIAVLLTITMVILGFELASLNIVFSNSNSGNIDVFTQKSPYDGKGSNIPSDAFGPEEGVNLSAFVTYNGAPVENLLVAFDVGIPSNKSFLLSSRTDLGGVATVSFTISMPPIEVNETEIFGIWSVTASVVIDGNTIQDSLIFKVDWIVKLISVRTLNGSLVNWTNFGRDGEVGIEIALRNAAMSMKSTMLSIVIQDELRVLVSSFEIHDLDVPPNERLIYVYCKLLIPRWAFVGVARIHVSAYVESGESGSIPYCPAISTDFYIQGNNSLSIALHDVGIVTVVPSSLSVEQTQPLNIHIMTRNEGTEVESYDVDTYFGSVKLETRHVTLVIPYGKTIFDLSVDTSTFEPGNYTLNVLVPPLANEADLTDNVFTIVVEIKPKLNTFTHNIAVTGIELSNNTAYVGDLLQINASILNKGNVTETFNVGTYYGFALVGILQVSNLAPNSSVLLVFTWNTSSVPEGFYQISSSAPLSGDVDISDNTYVDGTVQIMIRSITPLRYYLTVQTSPLGIAAINGEGWYNETTDVPLTALDYVPVSENVRYRFNQWDVDGTPVVGHSVRIVMDANHTATAHYTIQYRVIFTQSGLDSSATGIVVTVNGISETLDELPYSIWIDGANVVVYSYSNVSSATTGKRFLLTATTGSISPLTVTDTVTVIGNYTTQYLLTVKTDPEGITVISGENWYDQGADVTLTALTVVKYDFSRWDVDGISRANGINPITVQMNSTHIATAHYSLHVAGWYVFEWFYWLLLLLLILIIILLIILLYRRRRKKKQVQTSFKSGWVAWFYGYYMINRKKQNLDIR